jgi:hypothetical protein
MSKPYLRADCGKRFTSKKGQTNHRKMVHLDESNVSRPKQTKTHLLRKKWEGRIVWPTSPPFPNAKGEQVPPAECSQSNSFGHFKCKRHPSGFQHMHSETGMDKNVNVAHQVFLFARTVCGRMIKQNTSFMIMFLTQKIHTSATYAKAQACCLDIGMLSPRSNENHVLRPGPKAGDYSISAVHYAVCEI